MEYPGIRLKLYNHSTPQAVEAVKSGKIEFAVVTTPVEMKPPLKKIVLQSFREILVGGKTFTALGSQVPLKPQELTGVVSYINTRSLGGVAAFFISALGYLGTAFVVSHIGNYIDKKVRILR